MEVWSLIKYYFRALIKGLVVGVITLIGTVIGHFLISIIGIDIPTTSILLAERSSALLFFSMLVITALLVGELFKKLNQSFIERAISIFLYHFFFFYFLKTIHEFLSNPNLVFSLEFFCHIVPSVFFSVAVALLWKPMTGEGSIFEKVEAYYRYRNFKKWMIRFIIATVSFAGIYYLTTLLISPFVEPFYNDLGNSVVNVRSIYIVFLVNLIVGALFSLALMPIFILWKRSKTSLLFWVGFPIFIQAAVFPSSVEVWLPLGMRFPYLIQQMVITYLMAIILVQLFYVPCESDIIEDQFKWMY